MIETVLFDWSITLSVKTVHGPVAVSPRTSFNDVWDIVFEQRDIIIVPFPFSDLSGSKQRPVLILSTLEYNKHTEDLIT